MHLVKLPLEEPPSVPHWYTVTHIRVMLEKRSSRIRIRSLDFWGGPRSGTPHLGTSILLILVLALTACSLPAGTLPVDDPRAGTREHISLSEAQRLVPFTICLPTSLPSELTPVPDITYRYSSWDPADTYLEVRYYRSSDNELAVEIDQWDASGSLATTGEQTKYGPNIDVRELLAWQLGWEGVDAVQGGVKTTMVSESQVGFTQWQLTILAPASLQATLLYWRRPLVTYYIYSRLSAEDSRDIARSMHACAPSRYP